MRAHQRPADRGNEVADSLAKQGRELPTDAEDSEGDENFFPTFGQFWNVKQNFDFVHVKRISGFLQWIYQ